MNALRSLAMDKMTLPCLSLNAGRPGISISQLNFRFQVGGSYCRVDCLLLNLLLVKGDEDQVVYRVLKEDCIEDQAELALAVPLIGDRGIENGLPVIDKNVECAFLRRRCSFASAISRSAKSASVRWPAAKASRASALKMPSASFRSNLGRSELTFLAP